MNRQLKMRPGAYGLQIEGLASNCDSLGPAPDHWPLLQVLRTLDPNVGPVPGPLRIWKDRAQGGLADGVKFLMTRDPLCVRFNSQRPLSEEALLHPYLALPALIANYWFGRQVLHGGAFAHKGRGWGVLGDRFAGKSSMLAALLHDGAQILSDDVLVIEEHELFSGPPSIDLRREASDILGGERLGVLGSRERYRLRAPVPPPSVVLAGFIVLDWASDVSTVELSISERVKALADSSEIALNARSADSLLALVQMPVLRLSRPRDLGALPGVAAQLLTRLSQL
jgi:hypothetical protein